MGADQVINIEGVGDVAVRRSQRARRISVRMKPFGGVELVLPSRVDIHEGISFVRRNSAWIAEKSQLIENKESRLTIFDEDTVFMARSFALKIERGERKDVSLVLKNGLLKIVYPHHLPVTHPGVQEAVRYGIEEALRREAKAFLPGRLAWLAREHGFRHEGVVVKNLKSRWGSCSSSGNINLNLHLMRLPDHLIDYVLLHELCHTVEHNHGVGFWALMDRVCNGKAKVWDKEMKNYQTRIY